MKIFWRYVLNICFDSDRIHERDRHPLQSQTNTRMGGLTDTAWRHGHRPRLCITSRHSRGKNLTNIVTKSHINKHRNCNKGVSKTQYLPYGRRPVKTPPLFKSNISVAECVPRSSFVDYYKNLAIANRLRVSYAHNTSRASIVTPWPWNLG